MNDPIILTVAVFAGVLAVVFLISSVTGRGDAQKRRRLDEHAVAVEVKNSKRFEHRNVLKEHRYSVIGPWNAVLKRFKPAQTAAAELTRANIKLTVTPYLFGRVLLAAGGFLIVRQVTGVLVFAIPVIPLGLILPRMYVIMTAKRRLKAFDGQLAEAIDLMVGALRAGYGFLQAMESVSREMSNPMREEFGKVLEKINLGTPAADALQELPERIPSYDLDMFVTAVTVQRSVGGNLAEVLENISDTVRERRRIRAEVMAITTGPRVSSYVIGLFPLGLLAFFLMTTPSYRQVMLGELIGQIMIAFSMTWSLIGFLLSTAVSKVEY
ncbi:MAG: type II secretion system F family protein [Chloroflexia bacterium]|nr:type II secretion system F family protein [Chloroflexia bacterium]